MIKLIVFDLDGVLIDSRDMHYVTLNKSLPTKYIISREDHLTIYDGLSTQKKLDILTETKGLPKELHKEIWDKKQKNTVHIVDKEFIYDERIRDILQKLKKDGFLIYVASNCIYKTVQMMLLRKGFMEFIDYFVSNEDVVYSKPSPEMYFKCMARANVSCDQTIIVEDSPVGQTAALSSGANVLCIDNPTNLTLDKIRNTIVSRQKKQIHKWKGECNVVIPMAGEGSRFVNAGYSFPKPLIDVNGKPMIQVVVENLGIDPTRSKFIFICREDHVEKYNLSYLLNAIAPNCEIVTTDGLTEGAACSILLAKEYINNDIPLILANSDQFMEWDSSIFMHSMITDNVDGGIVTFHNSHPKWSYAKTNDDGFVTEVAEKKPISTNATTGVYFWKDGRKFVKYAEQMIANDIRVNNEFYTAPVFNQAIECNEKIKVFPVNKMWGIGIPEDLNYFLANYK